MSVMPGQNWTVKKQRIDDCCLLKYAYKKKLEDCFTDTTVGVGLRRIHAHKIVLACYSGYFERKFFVNAEFTPSVSIPDMDDESVVRIIEFIYSKEIIINNENVMGLYFTAVKLEVKSAIQILLEYFESVVNIENCYFILKEANLHNENSLKNIAYKFMGDHFKKVSQSNEFLQFFKADLSSCISNIDKNQRNETLLYEAIIRWTKHSVENREEDFLDLFCNLDFDKFPCDYLLRVIAEERLVVANNACYRLVMEKVRLWMLETQHNKTKSKILSLGGNRTGSKVIEVFSLPNVDQRLFPDFPIQVQGSCSLFTGNKIFCLGGGCIDEQNSVTNKVLLLDLKNNILEWKEIAKMNRKRCFMGATVYNGVLVVCGGTDRTNVHSSNEFYMMSLNKWEFISPLKQARVCNSATTCAGWLYVLGGQRSGNVLSSVERLPTLHGKWELIQPMQMPRRWFASVSVKGTIFAIGGNTGPNENAVLNSVEQYDPSEMMWKYVKDLNIARDSHSACVLDNKIYVVGGLDASRKVVRAIECYDLSNDLWTVVGQAPLELFNHSLVAI